MLTVLGMTIVGYIAACVLLAVLQRSFLYFPQPAGNPRAAYVNLSSEGETLRLWSREQGADQAVLYFGGNGEDVSQEVDPLATALPEWNAFALSYRGYGGSTGAPTERAIFADALAAYDEVARTHRSVAVIGVSLGSGVATYVAANRPVQQLVLVTPFDSILKVAQSHYRVFPLSLLMQDRFDSASRVPQVKARTLILIAEHDEIIPRERSLALVRAFPESQVTVRTIPGADHNTIATGEYWTEIRSFLSAP
jgi:hypothetical protein